MAQLSISIPAEEKTELIRLAQESGLPISRIIEQELRWAREHRALPGVIQTASGLLSAWLSAKTMLISLTGQEPADLATAQYLADSPDLRLLAGFALPVPAAAILSARDTIFAGVAEIENYNAERLRRRQSWTAADTEALRSDVKKLKAKFGTSRPIVPEPPTGESRDRSVHLWDACWTLARTALLSRFPEPTEAQIAEAFAADEQLLFIAGLTLPQSSVSVLSYRRRIERIKAATAELLQPAATPAQPRRRRRPSRLIVAKS